MEINILHSDERGATELGWLHSRHSFSFGNYYNPKRMGFGLLKVFNDDIVEPSKGFGTHFHDNFEIVSIVLEGTLEHKDSIGNHGVINTGDIQRISAGTGISHSEFNHSGKEKVHFLQIWVQTKEKNMKPDYEQKSFSRLKKNELVNVVCGKKKNDSIYIYQDVNFLMGNFDKDRTDSYKIDDPKHGFYVFVIDGNVDIENNQLKSGDSAEIKETNILKILTKEASRFLLIEVPLK